MQAQLDKTITKIRKELEQFEQHPDKDIGQALEIILSHLLQDKIVQSAVLADEQGLSLAGSDDEHRDALAVIAAMFDDLVKRLPKTPPVKNVKQINVIDEKGETITAQYFQVAPDNQLIFVSLTPGPPPEWKTLNKLFEEVLKGTSETKFLQET